MDLLLAGLSPGAVVPVAWDGITPSTGEICPVTGKLLPVAALKAD
jgi:hypothetical protein